MRRRLKWLTAIAGITLLAMIGLQIFWLRSGYKEQERAFMADAENALYISMLHSELDKLTGDDTLIRETLKAIPLDKLMSSLGKHIKSIDTSDPGHMSLDIDMPDSLFIDTVKLQQMATELQKRAGKDKKITISPKPDAYEPDDVADPRLVLFKKNYEKELLAKGYHVKTEIAIIDSMRRILSATIDTGAFRDISLKTTPDMFGMPVEKLGRLVQVGFPDITMELLRKMGAILIVSILLFIICIVSSSYLMFLFFKQKRVSEIKNDFMNNMTHELKTPISSVSVAIELMNDAGVGGRPEAMKDYLRIAQSELNRLTMLVEKVLKIAAFEKSDISIRKESFLAAAWLQNISNSFKPIFETGGVLYDAKVKPELLMITGDKTHLTNVLQNLIDNALKYNDKAKAVIDVIIQETDTETYIMVKDNGKGISNTDQHKVFDKFFRVPSGNVHDVKGYGHGLSYVKEIVALHNGQIKVESVLNQGSTFIVILPK